ncbi:MAG: rRNA maturation RNase YbeY [Patescibacteria group bacterium]
MKHDSLVCGRRPSGFTAGRVTRITGRALADRGSADVIFLTRDAMKKLNRRFRGKDRATDVLSFSPAKLPGQGKSRKRGEIFVASVVVRENARRLKRPYAEEMVRVLVHGALHLAGYDHATLRQERVMFAKQERLVESLKPKVSP